MYVMNVVIAGGHGQIALRLGRLLGERATGLVRNPAHVADVEAIGARAVVCDLEKAGVDELAGLLRDAGAAVIAALLGTGAGVGSTLELVTGGTAVDEAVRLIE